MTTNTMPQLNLSNAISLTLTALRAGTPVLCHGSPGIGKSQGWAREVAQRLNATLHTFIPSHHDPVAINGLPTPNVEEKTTEVLMTDFFAGIMHKAGEDPNSKHLIFLDEIGQASPAHQAPLMELIHEKKVAGRRLPDNCYLIAATNKLDDGAMVQRMATPLRNRFVHFELVPDRKGWLEWLTTSPANDGLPRHFKTLIQGFLEFKPDSFYTFDAKRHDLFTFATPRSWTAFTRLLAAHKDPTTNTPITPPYKSEDISTIHLLAQMSVGEPVASDFAAYAQTYANLPAMADIEAGRNPSLNTSDAAVLYALTTALTDRLRTHMVTTKDPDDTTKTKMANLHNYAMAHLPKDLQVWLVKTLVQDNAVTRTPLYRHWQNELVSEFINDNIDLLV